MSSCTLWDMHFYLKDIKSHAQMILILPALVLLHQGDNEGVLGFLALILLLSLVRFPQQNTELGIHPEGFCSVAKMRPSKPHPIVWKSWNLLSSLLCPLLEREL